MASFTELFAAHPKDEQQLHFLELKEPQIGLENTKTLSEDSVSGQWLFLRFSSYTPLPLTTNTAPDS